MTFEDRYGFPRSAVHLGNWRTAPYCRWSFQNAAEIVPSARIAGAGGREATGPADNGLLGETIEVGPASETVEAFLTRSATDLFVVSRGGKIVADWHAQTADPDRDHIVFSISKSLTALAAGVLESHGVLDMDKPVAHYLPEASGSGYGDCALRHVMDMRASIGFDESYLNADGDYARYRTCTLWNPPIDGWEDPGLAAFLISLPKGEDPHGGVHTYLSPTCDLLGMVVERAAGKRYAHTLSDLVWTPMGARHDAEVTVDRFGTARAAGGVSVHARDLLRVGEIMMAGGAVEGKQVIPESFVADMRANGDPEAWRKGSQAELFDHGRYRSQWYQPGTQGDLFCAIGIHGQWLWVDPSRETVIVKLASQALPDDDALDDQNVAFLQAVSEMS